MEEKLIELLISLGLNQNEIDVYLDLIKNSASTAYSIANRIGLHRSSVYEAIKKLHTIGFVIEIQDKSRKLYQTQEHSAIEEYLKQKLNELKEITPYLKEITNTETPKETIALSYGSSRLLGAITTLIEKRKELLIWVLPKKTEEILGDWFLKEISNLLEKKEVTAKILTAKETSSYHDLLKSRHIEIRHQNENSNIFTIVSSDTVLLIVLSSPIMIVEMKHNEIAEGFRSRFFSLWEKSLHQ